MCTDNVLREKLQLYCIVSGEIADLEKLKKELSAFILEEMENRETMVFSGEKIITERLTENVTKEGREKLKREFPDTIDNLLTVNYSKYVNKRAAEKDVNRNDQRKNHERRRSSQY